MNATIAKNEIPVRHDIRQDVDREFLTISVPNGWDDVKQLTKKVLLFENRRFVFSGWNSDTNECYFYRLLNGQTQTARII